MQLTRLVNQLDRLPLAIELCACRADVLSPEQLLGELESGRELLSKPTETAFGELPGLGEALESAWAALAPRERSTLEGCSVFVGPFSVQAASAIMGPPQPGEEAAAVRHPEARPPVVARSGGQQSRRRAAL